MVINQKVEVNTGKSGRAVCRVVEVMDNEAVLIKLANGETLRRNLDEIFFHDEETCVVCQEEG